MSIEHFEYAPPERADDAPEGETTEIGVGASRLNERFLILTIRRGDRVAPMSVDWKLQAGDVAAIAVNEAEGDEARAALGEAGWKTVVEEGAS